MSTTQELLSRSLKTKLIPLTVRFDEKDITIGDDFKIIINEGLEKSTALLVDVISKFRTLS